MSKQSLDLKVKRGSGFGCQTLRGNSLGVGGGVTTNGMCGFVLAGNQSREVVEAVLLGFVHPKL